MIAKKRNRTAAPLLAVALAVTLASPAAVAAQQQRRAEGSPQAGERGAARALTQRQPAPADTIPALALPIPPAGSLVAITNATIMTASHGTIERGTIVIRNGRIAAVGQGVAVPAGARVIDGTGMWVIPGIIDAHSHSMSEAINEGTESITAQVRIEDILRQDPIGVYRQLAGGVTTLNILHGSANTIGGHNAVVKLRWGLPVDSMLFQGAPPGIKFALGENVRQTNRPFVPGSQQRFPRSRQGVEALLRERFTAAQEYRAEWQQYQQARRNARRGQPAPVPPRRDLQLETLVEILEGRRLVHAHSYRADEILMLLGIARDFDFRIASFQHVLEGYKVADELAAAGAGASTFADNWAFKIEAYDAIPHNMAIMYERGVRVSINSDSDERARRMYQEAAKAMKYGGVPEEEALRMITLNAAYQLGIENRVGSIEVGKDADLAIFNGHPFAPASRVEMTLIDGRVFFDRSTAPTLEDLMQRMQRERPAVPVAATGASR